MHNENPGATFQAASQFNCLEFGSPHVTPEYGVSSYAYDETQGPACALACASGTIFRNYFAHVNPRNSSAEKETGQNEDELGQSEMSQLNTLDILEMLLHNEQQKYWEIRNGYSFSDVDSLTRLNTCLQSEWPEGNRRDELRAAVKVGVQHGVGVTFSRRFTPFPPEDPEVLVNQVYCSALSCGYSGVDNQHWAPLATLVLDASYEATLLAALCCHLKTIREIQQKRTATTSSTDANITTSTENKNDQPGVHKVFLTFLGGGVFRNEAAWIACAIGRALAIVTHQCSTAMSTSSPSTSEGVRLQVVICHFRRIDTVMCDMIEQVFDYELGKLQRSR